MIRISKAFWPLNSANKPFFCIKNGKRELKLKKLYESRQNLKKYLKKMFDHAIILIVVDGLSPSGKATDSDSVIKGSNPFSPVTIKALIESAFLLVHLKRKAKLLMLKVTNYLYCL